MRYVFDGIDGAEWYGITSLLIFTLFFIGVSLWAFRKDKSFLDRMKHIPFDQNSETNQNIDQK